MATAGSQNAHPLYQEMKPTWAAALDVYEGLGGFLDPERPYLTPHPREWLDHSVKVEATADKPASSAPNPNPSNPSPKLKMRRKLARYENIAESILTTVSGALFLHPPTRTFGKDTKNDSLKDWRTDVDGTGTAIDDFMQQAWTAAGVFGHTIILVDKDGEAGATAADATRPILSRYTPLDMIDWIVDERGQLAKVKFLEAAPREDFTKPYSVEDVRVRVVDETSWTLYDRAGTQLETGEHGFGRLPVVVLYSKRRALTPVIGKGVMGDPYLHIDLYNLVSEVRELLRNQTFGILNIPLGSGTDASSVEREQTILGQQVGTGGVMFSTHPANYLSPDGTNAQIYHEHMDRLARMIYRLASAPWDGDSKDAESADSRRMKQSETTNVLAKYASELQQAELAITELVYRAQYGPDRWQKQWDAEQPSVAYSADFAPPDVEAIATAAAEVIGLDLGPTATKELKKRIVRSVLQDADQELLKAIDTEIDAQEIKTAEEKRQDMLATMTARAGQGDGGEDNQSQDPPPDQSDAQSGQEAA